MLQDNEINIRIVSDQEKGLVEGWVQELDIFR